jgi:hypothetical protein
MTGRGRAKGEGEDAGPGWAAWRRTFSGMYRREGHEQLMAENQNLDLEPRPRFEQRCNKAEDEAYRVDHSAQV